MRLDFETRSDDDEPLFDIPVEELASLPEVERQQYESAMRGTDIAHSINLVCGSRRS